MFFSVVVNLLLLVDTAGITVKKFLQNFFDHSTLHRQRCFCTIGYQVHSKSTGKTVAKLKADKESVMAVLPLSNLLLISQS